MNKNKSENEIEKNIEKTGEHPFYIVIIIGLIVFLIAMGKLF